jgi:hypothetical protein
MTQVFSPHIWVNDGTPLASECATAEWESQSLQARCDLTGLIECTSAGCLVKKIKTTRRTRLPPLETGQVWRMAEANLQVGMIGKLLVHYKLGKPDAVRIPNSCSARTVVEKYLKKNKAVLV